MMNILLLGQYGQLGWELHRSLLPLGRVIARDYPEIDICDRAALEKTVGAACPSVIINASAYTAVDRAESEPEIAMAVNARAPGNLAQIAADCGAVMIHYSTDYVFDGTLGRPYTEDDIPNPLGAYAASKLAGEAEVAAAGGTYLILRTSWLYSLRRDNFVKKVLGWARQTPILRLVDDQIGNPTWARPLAEITAHLVAMDNTQPDRLRELSGLYHVAGSGYSSRLEWAQEILRNDPHPEEQCVREIIPASTADFPTPARRPLFSALDCTRFIQTFGLQLPPWDEALRLAMNI